MENDNLEKMIAELLDEVRLITIHTKVDALTKFTKEFLTSDLRKKMYEAFDGVRTFSQISDDLDCKLITLQQFAQALTDNDLVNYETKGNARILRKSLSKIAIYYAKKQLTEV